MQFNKLLAALAVGLAFNAPASAALLFNQSDISGGLVQNFDDAAGYDTSTSRVQIGNSLNVNLGLSTIAGQLNFGAPFGAWALSGNGEWTSAKTFAGVDGAFANELFGIASSLVFDFGGATVNSVGAFINYDDSFTYGPGFPLQLYIAAYDSNHNLLEDHFLFVSTPGAINDGSFYGIGRGTADIASFEISAPYAVVDDFTFSAPVPEPESYALLLGGLGVLGAMRKRRA